MEQVEKRTQQPIHEAHKAHTVTFDQIRQVQNAIEQCMQLYMQPEDIFASLRVQARIEPNFSRLVWAKLEEQNADFFRHYKLRVRVKEQIIRFNQLLGQQAQMLQKIQQQGMQSADCNAAPTSAAAPSWPVVLGASAGTITADAPGSTAVDTSTTGAAAHDGADQIHGYQLHQQQQAAAVGVTALQQRLQQQVQQQLVQTFMMQQHQAVPGTSLGYGGMPLPTSAAALSMMPGLPHPLMANPAVLAAAAAMAAAAASTGAAAARMPIPVKPAATTSTGATAGGTAGTPVAAAGSNSHGFAGSTTQMLAAWGLGGAASSGGEPPTPVAAAQAAGDHAMTGQAGAQQQQQQDTEVQVAAAQHALHRGDQSANAGGDAAYLAAMPWRNGADTAATQTAGTAAGPTAVDQPLLGTAVSDGYATGPSSSDALQLDVAPDQMPLQPLAKPFSMSDLNALDIPGQLTGELGGGELGDFSGMNMGEGDSAKSGSSEGGGVDMGCNAPAAAVNAAGGDGV